MCEKKDCVVCQATDFLSNPETNGKLAFGFNDGSGSDDFGKEIAFTLCFRSGLKVGAMGMEPEVCLCSTHHNVFNILGIIVNQSTS